MLQRKVYPLRSKHAEINCRASCDDADIARQQHSNKAHHQAQNQKRIKKACIEADKTLSRYVLDIIDPLDENTVRNELQAVEEQLNRYGGRMSYEERTALKMRRSELKKELENYGK